MRPTALRIFHSSSGRHRNTSRLKTNRMNVLNTFYQHLHTTPVTLHNAGFFYDCLRHNHDFISHHMLYFHRTFGAAWPNLALAPINPKSANNQSTTVCFAYSSTRNRDWLLPNIFAYFLLPLQQISASLGLRKLAFSSPCLTFGSECNLYPC
ncbi:hypothetical protein AVEN_39711-1 [Araneus ventricosus]|uniref:Uncharacterized protein n=1 Tax=Araneus ventricosus TaxID=182803 RepID=A0A4Y2LVG5_ARAVE|nr:hypothetical protein AVEN_39711-1 [Araneus ventricosus]